MVYRLPSFLQPDPARYAFVLAIDEQGDIVHNLQDSAADCYAPITSVNEHQGKLYLGSLGRTGIARMAVPTTQLH